MKGQYYLNFNEITVEIHTRRRNTIFVVFADVLMEKFGQTEEYKTFSTILSRWLTGAADREGGRKQRKCSAE